MRAADDGRSLVLRRFQFAQRYALKCVSMQLNYDIMPVLIALQVRERRRQTAVRRSFYERLTGDVIEDHAQVQRAYRNQTACNGKQ
jgi:hypothetical protein